MALFRTKIGMFRQTVRTVNAHDHELARTRNCNAIGKPGPEVSMWLHRQQTPVATSSHEEKSIALPDSNVALLRDRLTVKPRYRPALAIILPHPFLVRFISCFTFLCLTGCSLADAARFSSLHNRTSRWTLASSTATRKPRTQASCIVLQSRGTHSCACAWSLAEFLWQIKSGEWQNKIDCARTNCPRTFYI